jgi:radical SAM superfamily enzyme YgiQ (UPF0313 family)
MIGGILKENGYEVVLLDCMDRNHPSLIQLQGIHNAINRDDGTGRFYKEFVTKPEVLKVVPRRFGRYGLPLAIVEEELAKLSPPDVIFVTSGMTYWYLGVKEMISLLKRVFQGIPVILGGIYASLCSEHARGVSGADRVVTGEGEIKGLKIADEITGHRSDTTRYRSLDDFPGPSYDLYDRLNSAALVTSRGCPFRCPFCASRLLATGYRRRSPMKVVDEIEHLHRRRGVREFAFYDDALLLEKEEHLVPILEEVVERKLRIHFHTPNGIQPREVNELLARLMRKAGFKTIRLSYETSNRRRQELMGFKVKDDDLVNAVGCLSQAGFNRWEMGSYVLMGLPGQALEEVVESMIFVLRLGVKVSLASFSPIPGTQNWQEVVDRGILPVNADPLLTNNSVFPVISNEIPYEIFLKLGTLSAVANRVLNRGGDPMKEPKFLNALKKLMNNPKDR